MTARNSGVGSERLNAVAGGIYQFTPQQRRDATALVHRRALNADDEQHLLTVLALNSKDGTE